MRRVTRSVLSFSVFGLSLTGVLLAQVLLWQPTASLNHPRLQTPGTLLNDGRVLLAGSLACTPDCYSFPTAEIYDPSVAVWTETAPMLSPHFNHAIARLQDGSVLVVGGYLTPGVLSGECEIFDPSSGTWTLTGNLATPRQFHRGVALNDGRVLIAGGLGMDGQGSFTTLASAEIYNPATGQWSSAGMMASARTGFTLTLLADGRVLAIGGNSSTSGNLPPLATGEVYDPASNTWKLASLTGSSDRSSHTATPLSTGRVLVAGGYDASGIPSRTAALYDPVNDQWTPAASMRVPRAEATATLLGDGRVLVLAGVANWVTSEIYDPGTDSWSPCLELNQGRSTQSATLLEDGRILAAGGTDIDNNYLTSAELLNLPAQRPAREPPRL